MLAARKDLAEANSIVLVLSGDVPLVRSETLAALLEQQGLTEDEMRAVAEQLDAGTAALPQGLVSLGMTDTVTMSTSESGGPSG